MNDTAAILAGLARAKAVFQLRAIEAVIRDNQSKRERAEANNLRPVNK